MSTCNGLSRLLHIMAREKDVLFGSAYPSKLGNKVVMGETMDLSAYKTEGVR